MSCMYMYMLDLLGKIVSKARTWNTNRPMPPWKHPFLKLTGTLLGGFRSTRHTMYPFKEMSTRVSLT